MWMRYLAVALALAWGGWWTFFGVACGIGERLGPLGTLIHAAVPGLLFLASALVAWRWPGPGVVLLLAEALLVLIGYPLMVRGRFPFSTVLFIWVTMALPPLIAALLLWFGRPGMRTA